MEFIAQRFDAPALSGVPVERPASPSGRVAARPSELRFAIASSLAELEALGPEWNALFDACGRPQQVFQSFAWLRIWASIYADAQTRLSIVTGRRAGRLVMVWPLVVSKICGVRVLSGMGEPLSQYADALLAADLDASEADALYAFVASQRVDVLAMRRVRDDAPIAPLLHRGVGAPVSRQAAPFVDLAGLATPKAFEDRFPSKLRASRRRRRRRLAERGPLRFDHHLPSPEAAALVPVALGFKRDWARRHGLLAPALFDPRFERFFVAATLAGDEAPDLRVSALRCGDAILGVEISVACKGWLFGHVLAPSPDASQFGVGGVLAESILTNALTRGRAGVDLLAPADSYKREWTDLSVGVGDYVVARTWRGALYTRLWLRGGRDLVKRIAGRLRPGIAKVLGRRGIRGPL